MISKIPKRTARFIPSCFTLANATLGFLAILNTLIFFKEGDVVILQKSAIFLLLAALFDSIDGFTARKLDVCSTLGMELDSFSDLVTFGIAPGVITAGILWYPSEFLIDTRISGASCVIYVLGAILRLAMYNVEAMKEDKEASDCYFSGLPSPAAALCVCVFIFNLKTLEVNSLWKLVMSLIVAALGFLMVSNIHYIHIVKFIQKQGTKAAFYILTPAVILLVTLRFRGLAIVLGLYLLSGVVISLIKKNRTNKL